ncbi:MAG: PadR family transcriptional regulator [Gemmatimonadetes bacterium]|nr:PadR family transcriptional regulator [Gemmatimonadota bacterium]
MPRTDAADLLPLTPVVLHMLVAVAGEAKHGYAIAQEVERSTDGVVRLGPGTLYGSLQRMLDAGLIEEVDAPDPDEVGVERRRYYGITQLGARALREDTARLSRAVRLARSRLGTNAAG